MLPVKCSRIEPVYDIEYRVFHIRKERKDDERDDRKFQRVSELLSRKSIFEFCEIFFC